MAYPPKILRAGMVWIPAGEFTMVTDDTNSFANGARTGSALMRTRKTWLFVV
jgi:hypothetical protein